jgi:hypothetical protein
MSAKYDDDEICIDDDCRYMPKNGPIPNVPTIRFDMTSGLNCLICCICITLLIFMLGPLIVKMNSKRIIKLVKGLKGTAPATAAELLASTTSPVNVTDL